MVTVRKHRKMSLLMELEILGAGFLQRWRAYGAGKSREDSELLNNFSQLFNCKQWPMPMKHTMTIGTNRR